MEGAGQVVDEDEEEDWADDRALGDSVGKREGRCGSSADEFGATGKVAAEPSGLDAIPLELVQKHRVVHTDQHLAQFDRRQRRDVTDIDLPSRPFDNVKNGIFGGVRWAIGILGRGKDVVSDEIGCKVGAHDFFEDFLGCRKD